MYPPGELSGLKNHRFQQTRSTDSELHQRRHIIHVPHPEELEAPRLAALVFHCIVKRKWKRMDVAACSRVMK
ncbi:hypothetical protein C8034_v010673 [Colletotrichum sidae]|uniref:Uncharacterized protein n=1 Tax=Colletotrichum sidae TaxID=1347389 RepID=A0A4R8TA31_9PEZI|nr:hypothetical protein C8034_v010673 [Colletotrichum sidae]